MKSIYSYSIGFALSILLTLLAPAALWFHASTHHVFPSHQSLIGIFVLLAIGQLIVQLSFFLHLDQEAKPRWNLISMLFAMFIVCVLVGGSIWIMNHLSHMQMSDEEIFANESIAPEHTH